jgi:hypothetical protein
MKRIQTSIQVLDYEASNKKYTCDLSPGGSVVKSGFQQRSQKRTETEGETLMVNNVFIYLLDT